MLSFVGVHRRARLGGLRFGFFDFGLIIALADPRQHRSRDNCVAFLEVTYLPVDAPDLLQRLNVAVYLKSQFHLCAWDNRCRIPRSAVSSVEFNGRDLHRRRWLLYLLELASHYQGQRKESSADHPRFEPI